MQKPVLERAFELARSGRVSSGSELDRILHKEGYSAFALEGKSLRKQLRDIIKASAPAPRPDLVYERHANDA
jgi:hypothetical protein